VSSAHERDPFLETQPGQGFGIATAPAGAAGK